MRTWVGFAAVGAGLVHLGVAAGAAPALLALLAAVGVAELAWGAAALARQRVPLPHAAFAVAVVAVAGWVGLLLLLEAGSMAHMSGGTMPAAGFPAPPMLGAAVLDLAGAAVLAVGIRRGTREAREPKVWTYLAGVLAGAAVVAAITVVSLGATPVGALARQGMDMGH